MNAANPSPAPAAARGLLAGLLSFQDRVNAHPRVPGLLKGWNPVFHLECTDTGRAYSLRVRECRAETVAEGHEDAAHVIRLQATEADLEALFTGRLNPVEAHSDLRLEVYGEPKDHVKLDALTMVLWNA